MLVTFSGLDGAGKTTLIDGLRNALEGSGRPVRVLTMYDHVGVYALLRRVRALIRRWTRFGAQQAGVVRGDRDASTSVWLCLFRNRLVKQSTYPIDLAMFLLCRLYQEVVRRRVLILDRYFYDSIVDVAEGARDRPSRALARWVPTPDLPIYVEASPEIAFARKREYSVDRLHVRQQLYHQLFAGVDRVLVVRNQDGAPVRAVEAIASRVVGGWSRWSR